jgi:hypothetical protein
LRRGDASGRRQLGRAAAWAVAGIALTSGCGRSSPREPAPGPAPTAESTARPSPTASHGAAPAATRPRFIQAPDNPDPVEPVIQEQVEFAAAAGERALVYVGASWCEPCRRFHAAVTRGELDDLLAKTRLLEFDADRDDPALHRAGYAYEFLPVIALPGADGRSSGRLLSGSIKGEGAVERDLVPRLRALLAGRAVD